MTEMKTPPAAGRRHIQLERHYRSPLADVWELWTTREGIESWWGPDGFSVKVLSLDLRAGGKLLYAMTASAPQQVAFMKRAGMPVTTETQLTYTDVFEAKRLAYYTRADFIPGVEPYNVGTVVDLAETEGGVRMSLSIETMHDEVWTGRAIQGWESQLGKLDKLLG